MKSPLIECPFGELRRKSDSDTWVVTCAIIFYQGSSSKLPGYNVMPEHCKDYLKCEIYREEKEKNWARKAGRKYSSLAKAEKNSSIMIYPTITLHRNSVFPYNEWRTYEWEGSKYETASINCHLIDELPWPVKIICDFDFGRSYIVARKDIGLGLWWRLVRLKYWLRQRFLKTKVRIILTAMVWNLAYWPEGTTVSWKYLFKKRKNMSKPTEKKLRLECTFAMDIRDGYGAAGQELLLALDKKHDIHLDVIKLWYSPDYLKERTVELMNNKQIKYDYQIILMYPSYKFLIKAKAANITMYEANRLPDEWIKCINNKGIPILASSKFVQEIFIENVKVPVHLLPFGLDQEFWARKERKFPEDRSFRFLIVGKLEPRKNTLFTVKAFQKAFSTENVQLIIKTREHFIDKKIAEIIQKDRRIKLIEKTVDEVTLRGIYYDCEAFIYVSRGEGFSFPPRFAVATGMPTLVTNWSALAEIPGTIKVDITGLSPMTPCGFSYGQEKELLMADVDENDAVDKMRYIYYNYEKNLPNVSQLTWEETVNTFDTLYRTMLT